MSDPIHTFPGADITIRWDARLCIHVGECGRAEGELFVGGRRPWCDPDQATPDAAAAVVHRCPTGALSYTRTDGRAEPTPTENQITVANHGPLYATGDLQISGAAPDMPGVRTRAALCRCGQSANKPFCDNSHEAAGFIDRGAIGSTGPGLSAGPGPLSINPAPDGPLLITGDLTLRTAAGRIAWQGTKCALCRCGHSANKPFCDGAHRAAGFKAD